MPNLFEIYSREFTIITLVLILVGTLIVIVPQLLKAHLRKSEMIHVEHIKALENGEKLPIIDDRPRLAGRLTLLVPMVVMLSAGTVTCFLAIYRSEMIFPVSLSVWIVGGVVSLAAITGGVALVGRLDQLDDNPDDAEEEFSENPFPR